MNIIDLFSLKGRTAIVTGGAQGLGYAMAAAMAQAGANLVIADINEETARRAAMTLGSDGTKCLVVPCDVTNEDSAEAVVHTTHEYFGSVDILLNNAGVGFHVNSECMELSDWKRIIDINLNGVFIMSKAAAKRMIPQCCGTIVNIASMSGLIVNTPQKQSAYNASKAAVIHLTRSLAAEWAPYKIRVNTIAPGYMVTAMTQQVFDENGPMVKRWMDLSPMGRPGQPEELNGAIIYLASDASSFTTGAVLTIDGGYSCW